MDTQSVALSAKGRAIFYQKNRTRTRVLALFVAIGGLFVAPEDAVLLFSIAFVIELIATTFKILSRKHFDLYRAARRIGLLEDIYGPMPDQQSALVTILDWSPTSHPIPALKKDTYYQETSLTGLARLLYRLHESAFFSAYLFRKARNEAITVAALLMILSLFFFALLPWLHARGIVVSKDMLLLDQFVLLVLTFLLSVDLFEDIMLYHFASFRCLHLLAQLKSAPSASESNAIALASDYAVWTASAPPVSDALYRRYNSLLTKLWKNESVQKAAANAPL